MLAALQKINIKSIQCFIAIVEHKGISAAQAQLHLSQSVISTHLKHLEETLGMVLCERGRSGFRLTPEGQAVYEACVDFSEASSAFQHRLHYIQQLDLQRGGHVRLAMAELLPEQFGQALQRVLAESYRQNPHIHFSIYLHNPVSMSTLIANNECDIGIGYYGRVMDGLNYDMALQERQQVYCGEQHPLFYQPTPSKTVLEHEYAWVKRTYQVPRQMDVLSPKHLSATAYRMEGTQYFILAGTHLGFLPVDVAAPYVAAGKMRALHPETIFYDVAHQWVYKPPLNRAVQQFLDAMQIELGNRPASDANKDANQ